MADNHLSLAQAAALLDRSERFVGNLRERGFVKTTAPGRYPLVGLIRGLIAHEEDQVAKQADTARQTAATDARTREIEMRIQRKMANLIARSDVEAVMDEWLPMFTDEMIDIPDRIHRDPAKRAELRAELDAVLDRMGTLTEASKTRLLTGEITP